MVVGFEMVVDFVVDEIDVDLFICGYVDEVDVLVEFGWCVVVGDWGMVVFMGDLNYLGY